MVKIKFLLNGQNNQKKYNAGYKIQYSKDKTFKKSVTEVVMKKTTKKQIEIKKIKYKQTLLYPYKRI